jgi:acetyl-CoA acetyltransferase
LADIVVAAILGNKPGPVRIVGVGHSSESAMLGHRRLAQMQAMREAVARACGDRRGIGSFDVLQLAGATLPDEALTLEALDIAPAGEGFDAYAKLSHVNPSGGGESGWCYPTNGLLNLVEGYLQLTQRAGPVQEAGTLSRALITGSSPMGGQVAHAVVLEAE